MFGSQFNIHLHSDPSLASGLPLVPLPADGSQVSSGTLGFCFIFRFLFGNDGIFSRFPWPMPGSPPQAFPLSFRKQACYNPTGSGSAPRFAVYPCRVT